MKGAFFLALLFTAIGVDAQQVYTIKADSTKLTGCDSTNELIIENHTRDVKGFLYNMGNGRTIFKKGLLKVSDSLYLIGGDSLKYNAWVQNGNKFGATGVLGTLDNNHLDIYTNNSQRMRFTNTGRLLVSTTTDNLRETIQLNGSMYMNGYLSNFLAPSGTNSGALRLRWGTGDGSYISFYYQNKITRRGYIASPSDTRPLIIEDSIGVSFKASPYVSIGSENALGLARLAVLNPFGATTDMFNVGRIRPDTTAVTEFGVKNNGNVIVGPGADNGNKFQVNGKGYFSDDVTTASRIGIGTSSLTAQLHTTGSVRFAGLTNNDTLTRIIVSDASGNLFYRNASSLASADVPPGSLAVNGPIRAKSLTLSQTGWPDYVFDSSYHLLPLNEVEDYVRSNKHLPGVPAAAVVEKDGLSVGEVQAVMLRKIEELTLYNIAQQKKLDAQQEELKILRQEMNAFRTLTLAANRHVYLEIIQSLNQINHY